MYLVVIINAIHLFVIAASFFYFFCIKENYNNVYLPYGKTAFYVLMKNINEKYSGKKEDYIKSIYLQNP